MEHCGIWNCHKFPSQEFLHFANINNHNNSQRAVKGHNSNVFSFIASVHLIYNNVFSTGLLYSFIFTVSMSLLAYNINDNNDLLLLLLLQWQVFREQSAVIKSNK